LLQSYKPATKHKHKNFLLPHPSPIVVNPKQKMFAFKLIVKQKANASLATTRTYKLGSNYYKVTKLQKKQVHKLVVAMPKTNHYKP
jgi:hypothetical protein